MHPQTDSPILRLHDCGGLVPESGVSVLSHISRPLGYLPHLSATRDEPGRPASSCGVRRDPCRDPTEWPLVLRLPSCRWAPSWRSIPWTRSWPRWWWPHPNSGGTVRPLGLSDVFHRAQRPLSACMRQAEGAPCLALLPGLHAGSPCARDSSVPARHTFCVVCTCRPDRAGLSQALSRIKTPVLDCAQYDGVDAAGGPLVLAPPLGSPAPAGQSLQGKLCTACRCCKAAGLTGAPPGGCAALQVLQRDPAHRRHAVRAQCVHAAA